MSIPRKIVALAGPLAQFAVADDGSVWFWNGVAWVAWGRPALPDREDPATVMASYRGHAEPAGSLRTEHLVVHPARTYPAPGEMAVEPFNPNNPPPVKRGPGRPRKVTT